MNYNFDQRSRDIILRELKNRYSVGEIRVIRDNTTWGRGRKLKSQIYLKPVFHLLKILMKTCVFVRTLKIIEDQEMFICLSPSFCYFYLLSTLHSAFLSSSINGRSRGIVIFNFIFNTIFFSIAVALGLNIILYYLII